MDQLREHTITYLARLRAQCDELRAQETAAIADAVKNKGSVAESYWKRRHHVETRIRAAVNLLEALQ